MCGEMQFEGACDEGSARVSCSEGSTSTKKVTSGVTWKVRATIALPANKYSAFSVYGYCNFSIGPFYLKKKMVIVMKILFFENIVFTVKQKIL